MKQKTKKPNTTLLWVLGSMFGFCLPLALSINLIGIYNQYHNQELETWFYWISVTLSIISLVSLFCFIIQYCNVHAQIRKQGQEKSPTELLTNNEATE